MQSLSKHYGIFLFTNEAMALSAFEMRRDFGRLETARRSFAYVEENSK